MKLALLAGTQSGCGKTTIMLALLQALKRQGKDVAAFKAGPDFLDPLWHQAITGKPSYNLDTRMVGIDQCRRILASQDAETGLIEGVMGLFDGRSGVGESGSSVDLAGQLGCPVLLVVDAKGMSGSIVPLVKGFVDYALKLGVTITAVIANRVGSGHHAEMLKTVLSEAALPPLVGWMLKDAAILSERHLGLVRPDETSVPDFLDAFQLDEAACLQAFSDYRVDRPVKHESAPRLTGKKIAIARDDACCFIYPANVDWLMEQGADIRYFSVLDGEPVPEQCDALWLPGGYPELYGPALAESTSWPSIRQFVEAGKPVLAECGGAILLGELLISQNGCAWPMGGVLPFQSRMQNKLASLGYREDESGVRGHEFHHSVRESEQAFSPAFNCARGDNGIRYKNLRASYIHWYFASHSNNVAQWFGA